MRAGQSTNDQEVEVKFLLSDQAALERRLLGLGASLLQPRILEVNLRFDTPDGTLTARRQVLRLRQDAQSVMTYKGPSQDGIEVSARQEIEFTVSNFAAAQHLLEALGYQVSVIYQKYRAMYALGPVVVTLDEMPFGFFAEIEGSDAAAIRAAAGQLGLDWQARSLDSYLVLFGRAKRSLGLEFRDLTFENFLGITVLAEDIKLLPADLTG
jgi:adenylate cyclase class 2